MASVAAVFDVVSQKFCIRELNALQKEAIIQFVEKQRDVFINLPTGKILNISSVAVGFRRHAWRRPYCCCCLTSHISLMKDQVQKLRNLGISAVTLSDIEEEDAKAVEKGVFSVVYGSPEAFLKIARWRKLLTSDVYRAKLCAIAVDEAHVIKQW